MKDYLDKTGLTYFWGKIKDALSQKADKTSLSSVATSGDYQDLTNTPTITTVKIVTWTSEDIAG